MRSILFLLLLGITFSCQTNSTVDKSTSKDDSSPQFMHNVYFYFNDEVNEVLAKDFTNGLDQLATIETIHKVIYGPPAMTPREVVDNTYDYAYLVSFRTKADHDAYQVDPIHLAFIEKYKSLWKEVKVYDNLVNNQNK